MRKQCQFWAEKPTLEELKTKAWCYSLAVRHDTMLHSTSCKNQHLLDHYFPLQRSFKMHETTLGTLALLSSHLTFFCHLEPLQSFWSFCYYMHYLRAFPCHQPLGVVLSNSGYNIFNMCNPLCILHTWRWVQQWWVCLSVDSEEFKKSAHPALTKSGILTTGFTW